MRTARMANGTAKRGTMAFLPELILGAVTVGVNRLFVPYFAR